jgi:beta-glucanase (GH16 family)
MDGGRGLDVETNSGKTGLDNHNQSSDIACMVSRLAHHFLCSRALIASGLAVFFGWVVLLVGVSLGAAEGDELQLRPRSYFAEEPSFQDDFEPGWEVGQTNWQVVTWRQAGTQMAAERCRVNDRGFLVQTVKAGEPFRGGGVQSKREFGYGRWLVRSKPSAVPGVLNGFFTKDWDDFTTPADKNDGKKAEVDLEFITDRFGPGRGEVYLAIHLKDRSPLWELNVPLNFNPSDDFHVWGFDILPDRVVWHVDGRRLHTWIYTDGQKIDPEYEFFINAWTRKEWLNGPPARDAEHEVDWVRFYPLKSGQGTGR